ADRAPALEGARDPLGRADRGQRRRGDRRRASVRRRRRLRRRGRARDQGPREADGVRGEGEGGRSPDVSAVVEHRFGPYGGQYVPETLMPALAELEAAWTEARGDAGFRQEVGRLLGGFA